MKSNSQEFPVSLSGKSGWPWTEASLPLAEKMQDGSPWPRISIVTPSFNQAQYLEETIRSVLLQGYPNLEYIIIDGGSTDGSVEIIKRYEPWLTYWVSEPDRGQSHAINKGVKKSSGEIIAWINSDDYYSENAFSIIASKFSALQQRSIGFIHGRSTLINQFGEKIGERGQELNLLDSVKRSVHPISQPSVFFSAQAVEKVGLLDENLHMSMDWDLFTRIALRFEVEFFPEFLSFFRMTETTKTSSIPIGFGLDMVEVLDKIYSQKPVHKDLRKIKSSAYCTAYIRCVGGYIRSNNFPLARKYFVKACQKNPIFCLSKLRRYLFLFIPKKS